MHARWMQMGSENTGGSPLQSRLFKPSPAYMGVHRNNGDGGGGGLVAKSCSELLYFNSNLMSDERFC